AGGPFLPRHHPLPWVRPESCTRLPARPYPGSTTPAGHLTAGACPPPWAGDRTAGPPRALRSRQSPRSPPELSITIPAAFSVAQVLGWCGWCGGAGAAEGSELLTWSDHDVIVFLVTAVPTLGIL